MEVSKRKFKLAIVLIIVTLVSAIMYPVFSEEYVEKGLAGITDENLPFVEGEEEEPGEQENPNVPPEDLSEWNQIKKEMNWLAMVNYAIDKYENGLGFKSYSTQQITIDAPVVGKIKQTVEVTSMKNQDCICTITNAYADNSLAENFYRYEYVKDGVLTTRTTHNGQTFLDSDKILTYQTDEYRDMVGMLPCENAFHLNGTNSQLVTLTQERGKFKISIRLTDINSAAAAYIKCMEYNGGSAPGNVEISLVYTINPRNGYIEQIKKDEKYTMSRGPIHNVPCKSSVVERFVYMNKNAEFELPE